MTCDAALEKMSRVGQVNPAAPGDQTFHKPLQNSAAIVYIVFWEHVHLYEYRPSM